MRNYLIYCGFFVIMLFLAFYTSNKILYDLAMILYVIVRRKQYFIQKEKLEIKTTRILLLLKWELTLNTLSVLLVFTLVYFSTFTSVKITYSYICLFLALITLLLSLFPNSKRKLLVRKLIRSSEVTKKQTH